MNKRKIGKEIENIVKDYFKGLGYDFVSQNFTIRGGEIDLIFEKGNELVFVEVKLVNHIDDFSKYITQKKLKSLNKAIQFFLYKYNLTDKNINLKFVFVRNKEIVGIYDIV